MGTVAQLARPPDYARTVLLAVRQHVEDRAASGRDPDLNHICRMLTDALDDPRTAHVILLGLSDFLCAACSGVSLDLLSWIPPRH